MCKPQVNTEAKKFVNEDGVLHYITKKWMYKCLRKCSHSYWHDLVTWTSRFTWVTQVTVRSLSMQEQWNCNIDGSISASFIWLDIHCLQTSNLYNTYVRSAWIHHSLLWEVNSENLMTLLIPRIESAKLGWISLAYLIRPGSNFRGFGSAVTPASNWFTVALANQSASRWNYTRLLPHGSSYIDDFC